MSLLSFLAAGIGCSIHNYFQRQKNQLLYTNAIRSASLPQQDEHKTYQPGKIQLKTREIAYQVSNAITLSYDYNNHYLLIKAYLETKDLPKETLRSRILGDDSNLSQVFMSTPYDAICIAMPPSCLNDNQTVTGIINRMESVWAEYAAAHVEQ